MIFLNPWAWLGLAAIAAPVIAHLLARRPARRLPFPTLRFLQSSVLEPVRRDRLADLGLLVVRVAVVAAAVAALAQPLWLSPARTRDLGSRIARAIIVDTSASMTRAAAGGGRAIDAARREAAALAAEATTARIGESVTPGSAMAGAAAWLATQPGRHEVIVISDFQPTAIARADLDALPASVGVRMVPVPVDPSSPVPPGGAGEARGTGGVSRATAPAAVPVVLLAGADERAAAAAAEAAATAIGAPAAGRADRPIAFVFPGFDGRSALLSTARPISTAWMFDVWMRILDDPTIGAAAARAGVQARDLFTVVSGTVEGAERLIVVANTPAHALSSAALMAAALRAVVDAPADTELTPDTRSAAELRAWERPPAAVSPADSRPSGDESDGRWWWAAALGLLIIETMIRRRGRVPSPAVEEPRARVA